MIGSRQTNYLPASQNRQTMVPPREILISCFVKIQLGSVNFHIFISDVLTLCSSECITVFLLARSATSQNFTQILEQIIE